MLRFDDDGAAVTKAGAGAPAPAPAAPRLFRKPAKAAGAVAAGVATASPQPAAPAPVPATAKPEAPKSDVTEAPEAPEPAVPSTHPRVRKIVADAAKIPVTNGSIFGSQPFEPRRPQDFDKIEPWLTAAEKDQVGAHAAELVKVHGDEESARRDALKAFYHANSADERFAGKPLYNVWGAETRGSARVIFGKSSNDRVLRFKTSAGTPYTMTLSGREEFGVPTHELLFHDDGGHFDVTGAGHAHEVFGNVVPAAVAAINHDKHPVVYFSAAEPSRQKLYSRLVRTISSAVPDYAAVVVHPDNPKAPAKYMVVRRDHLDKVRASVERGAAAGAKVETLIKAMETGSLPEPRKSRIEILPPPSHEEIEHWHTPRAWGDELPPHPGGDQPAAPKPDEPDPKPTEQPNTNRAPSWWGAGAKKYGWNAGVAPPASRAHGFSSGEFQHESHASPPGPDPDDELMARRVPAHTSGDAFVPTAPTRRPLPAHVTPSDILRAIVHLRAEGDHAAADHLLSYLPPADPFAHLGGPVPPAPDGAPEPSGGGAPGGLPAQVPQPDNPNSAGSLPPKLDKAYSPSVFKTHGPHEFACVYLLVPEPMRSRVLALGKLIPDEDLADDGREECPHLTLLTGL